jgi:hypothetical protein
MVSIGQQIEKAGLVVKYKTFQCYFAYRLA